MHADVDWPDGMEGGREVGHEAVRAYWTRQFGMLDSKVEPTGFSSDDEAGSSSTSIRSFTTPTAT